MNIKSIDMSCLYSGQAKKVFFEVENRYMVTESNDSHDKGFINSKKIVNKGSIKGVYLRSLVSYLKSRASLC